MSTPPTTVAGTSDGNPLPNQIMLLSSAEALSNKVGTALKIVAQLEDLVTESNERSCDKEVKTSAEATIINACNRLDLMLNDPKLWEIGLQDRILEKRLSELHDANVAIAQERLAMIREGNRPSRRYGARLMRRGPVFFAVLGADSPDVEGAVFGEGTTPEAAYTALDTIISGMPGETKIS